MVNVPPNKHNLLNLFMKEYAIENVVRKNSEI